MQGKARAASAEISEASAHEARAVHCLSSHTCASEKHPLVRQLPEKRHTTQLNLQRNQKLHFKMELCFEGLKGLRAMTISWNDVVFQVKHIAYQLGVGYG